MLTYPTADPIPREARQRLMAIVNRRAGNMAFGTTLPHLDRARLQRFL